MNVEILADHVDCSASDAHHAAQDRQTSCSSGTSADATADNDEGRATLLAKLI